MADTPHHLAHLARPDVVAAERAWTEHVVGSPFPSGCPQPREDRCCTFSHTWPACAAATAAPAPGCEQCRAAPGSPPPDCPPEQRELYACDEGVQLHEAAVRAAHAAYQASLASGGMVTPGQVYLVGESGPEASHGVDDGRR